MDEAKQLSANGNELLTRPGPASKMRITNYLKMIWPRFNSRNMGEAK